MVPQEGAELPATALCIINFNGSEYLPTTLARVGELREQFSEIVFVDDGSTDDSVELARKLLPWARIVSLSSNRGPGGARNAGLEGIGTNRVLFMDNDVQLDAHALPKLSSALDAHPRAVIAMPRIVSAEEPHEVQYEGGDAHVSGLLTVRGVGIVGDASSAELASVGSLVSCSFLFDKSRWADGPPFDELFHIYLEDHELGLRARMRGFELLVVPDAVGFHGNGTPGVSIRATGVHTPTRVFGLILHRWYVLLKLYQTRTLLLLAPYLVAFELFQLAGALGLGWGRHWMRAVGTLSRTLPRLMESRAAFKPLRRRPDVAVLTGGAHPFNPALLKRPVVRAGLHVLDAFAALNWAVARRLTGGAGAGG